ncbi:MAG TPA: zf-HC2 domain-containing protein [Candidatus Eisenbacteria bacterium]
MDCNEVLEQLSDYLDEDARAELCREIDKHLIHCRDCRLEVDTLRMTIRLVQENSKETIIVPLRAVQQLDRALARVYGEQRRAEAD